MADKNNSKEVTRVCDWLPLYLVGFAIVCVVGLLAYISINGNIAREDALHGYGSILLYTLGVAGSIFASATEKVLFTKELKTNNRCGPVNTFIVFLVLVFALGTAHFLMEYYKVGDKGAISVRYIVDAFKVAFAGMLTALTYHCASFDSK